MFRNKIKKRKKIFIFFSFLVLFSFNLLDIYLKYTVDQKYLHCTNKIVVFLPLFIITTLFLIIFSKQNKEILLYFLLSFLIASFSNIYDIFFNNKCIINYISFYFFYNNISDIALTLVSLFWLFYFLNHFKDF